MKVLIKEQSFQPYTELVQYQDGLEFKGKYGATASFVGSMRDFNDGDEIKSMTLEYYPGMTEKQITKICAKAYEKWALLDGLVIHRVGKIKIGEPIVLVSIWSAHRNDAFDASRFIMEELKHTAPFWKKETTASGERWVERNTDGYSDFS